MFLCKHYPDIVFHSNDTQSRMYEYDTVGLYSPIMKGVVLKGELLELVSIGSSRRDQYVPKYYVESHGVATRSREDVDLSATVSTSKDGLMTQEKLQ